MENNTQTYRSPIGFKVTDNKLAVIEEQIQRSYTLTDDAPFEVAMKRKGMEQAIILLQGYFDGYYKPFLTNRDEHFFEELKKLKIRFFDPM